MTVFDNVLTAKHMRAKQNVFSATLRINYKEEKRMREETVVLLEEQNLLQYANDLAVSLPYGLQRRLEIARALATDPTLLLLDEPAAGMNPQETQALGEFIVQIKNRHKLTGFHDRTPYGSGHEVFRPDIRNRLREAYLRRDACVRAGGRARNQRISGGGRMSEIILSIRDLKVNYGGIEAVKGISFDVPKGHIVTLIGANGAGKSSTLRTIAGLVKLKSGVIEFENENIAARTRRRS